MKNHDALEVIQLMENYHISPDILREHILSLQFNPKKEDLMSGLGINFNKDPKIKAKITREFNSKNKSSVK